MRQTVIFIDSWKSRAGRDIKRSSYSAPYAVHHSWPSVMEFIPGRMKKDHKSLPHFQIQMQNTALVVLSIKQLIIYLQVQYKN